MLAELCLVGVAIEEARRKRVTTVKIEKARQHFGDRPRSSERGNSSGNEQNQENYLAWATHAATITTAPPDSSVKVG